MSAALAILSEVPGACDGALGHVEWALVEWRTFYVWEPSVSADLRRGRAMVHVHVSSPLLCFFGSWFGRAGVVGSSVNVNEGGLSARHAPSHVPSADHA